MLATIIANDRQLDRPRPNSFFERISGTVGFARGKVVRVLYPRSGYYVSRTRGVAAARRCYIRQERRAPVATAVFHSALKPCAPRILLIRYIRKLIVIRWSRVYTRKSPRPSRVTTPSFTTRADRIRTRALSFPLSAPLCFFLSYISRVKGRKIELASEYHLSHR